MTDLCNTIAKAKTISDAAEDVSINTEALSSFAASIDWKSVEAPSSDHGGDDDATVRENLAAVLLAWNAINFSYFPDPGAARWAWQHPETSEIHGGDDEANGVFAALTHLQSQAHRPLASGAFLAGLTAGDLRDRVFAAAPGAGPLPLLELRARCLNELGAMLANANTTPLAFVEGCNASAITFVAKLTAACPLYADVQTWTPKSSSDGGGDGDGGGGGAITIAFHKRAQLCASMLQNFGVARFADIGSLTVFADYRIPQLFRSTGVFVLSDRLAGAIGRGEPVASGSREEVELRAATVYTGELLRSLLERRMKEEVEDARCHANVLDYFLWSEAVKRDVEGGLPPFHRTRTSAY